MILRLLDRHPGMRPSADELLSFPWLQPESPRGLRRIFSSPAGICQEDTGDAVYGLAVCTGAVGAMASETSTPSGHRSRRLSMVEDELDQVVPTLPFLSGLEDTDSLSSRPSSALPEQASSLPLEGLSFSSPARQASWEASTLAEKDITGAPSTTSSRRKQRRHRSLDLSSTMDCM